MSLILLAEASQGVLTAKSAYPQTSCDLTLDKDHVFPPLGFLVSAIELVLLPPQRVVVRTSLMFERHFRYYRGGHNYLLSFLLLSSGLEILIYEEKLKNWARLVLRKDD